MPIVDAAKSNAPLAYVDLYLNHLFLLPQLRLLLADDR
jgi:hypothetical protein